MKNKTRLGTPAPVEGAEGNRIACQVAGPEQSQPVVLTSGIGCGPVFYRHIGPELARDHRVIFWDFRAHGDSGPAPNGSGYLIRDHADDLAAVVRELTDRPPVMIGFSMGVQVTVEWFKRWRPESIPACVFLLGTPRNPLRSHWIWGNTALRTTVDRLLDAGGDRLVASLHPLSKAVLRSGLSHAIATQTGLVSEAFSRRDYQEFINYSSGVRPDRYLRTATGVLEHDALDAWSELQVPTLYIAGERDFLVPAAECRGVTSAHQNLTYSELLGRSHAGTVEGGPHLARGVRAFIAEHLAQAAARDADAGSVTSLERPVTSDEAADELALAG